MLLTVYTVVMLTALYALWSWSWVDMLRKNDLPARWAFVPFGHSIALARLVNRQAFDVAWMPFARISAMRALATRFDKGTGFAIGLMFLTPVFMPMLARELT